MNLTKKSKKKKEKKPKKEKEPEPAPEPAAAPVEDAKAAQEARLAKMAAGPAPGVAEDGLAIQDEKTVDVSKLDPLTHEVSTRASAGRNPNREARAVGIVSGGLTLRLVFVAGHLPPGDDQHRYDWSRGPR